MHARNASAAAPARFRYGRRPVNCSASFWSIPCELTSIPRELHSPQLQLRSRGRLSAVLPPRVAPPVLPPRAATALPLHRWEPGCAWVCLGVAGISR